MLRNRITVHPMIATSEPLLDEISHGPQLELLCDLDTDVAWAPEVLESSLFLSGPSAARDAWAPIQPTPVLDTLWRFAAERQRIYLMRLRGERPPWTEDAVLRSYRFTNVFRAADRVSQFLMSEVASAEHRTPEDVFFRIILFKLFNRIGTWELLERQVGAPSWREYRFDSYEGVLDGALAQGNSIYSPAYIMPPPQGYSGKRKHSNHLHLIESMMAERLPTQLGRAKSLKEVFEMLRSFPGIGDFLAYQFTIDLNYSSLIDFSESEYVVPGPGSLEGLEKCFTDTAGICATDMIRLLQERQAEEFGRLGLPAVTLWGRELQLIDCQNVLCEVAKYARVAHPEISSRSGRSRIKQRFESVGRPLPHPRFPVKWGLDAAIAKWMVQHASV